MRARRLGLWLQLLVGGLLLLAVWVLFVWVAARPALKGLIDLTPQHVNSVDVVTEDLLRELRSRKAQIEFHLFYPPSTGQPEDPVQTQLFRIRDQLRERTRLLLIRYQYLGGESVTIHAHDFYADVAATRDAAGKFDYRANENDVVVVAVQMPGKERRFRKLSLMLDLGRIQFPTTAQPMQKAQLPVLKAFVGEEQISSSIKGLLVEGTPVAYVLPDYSPGLTTTGEGAYSYSGFLSSLQLSGFEVREWRTLAQPKVPDDASLVIVLEPTTNFTDRTADALYEYVRQGGRVFLNFAWAPGEDRNPDGGRFSELLGYELTRRPVFHLIRDSNRTGGRGLDGDPAVANLQLRVTNHPITSRIARSGHAPEITTARAIRVRPGAAPGIRRDPFLSTGEQAWIAAMGSDGFPDTRAPQGQLEAFNVGMTFEVDVAADPARPKARKTGEVVIVTGLFCNNAGMPHFGDLAMNICNYLVERRELLDLKTPGYETKYLSLQPQQLERIGWLLIWGVPLFFLGGLGFVVFWRRRQ